MAITSKFAIERIYSLTTKQRVRLSFCQRSSLQQISSFQNGNERNSSFQLLEAKFRKNIRSTSNFLRRRKNVCWNSMMEQRRSSRSILSPSSCGFPPGDLVIHRVDWPFFDCRRRNQKFCSSMIKNRPLRNFSAS